MTKLNLGAGDTVLEGFTAIDRKLGTEVYPLTDYDDNSVEEIRASHILEHFGFDEVEQVLAEWVRVLKPGGRMRIAVPDVDKILRADDHPHRLHWLMGGQGDPDDFHKSAYTVNTLPQWMGRAGLRDIKFWESDNTDTASSPVSLNLEGFKPDGGIDVKVKIAALMSIPRVGWNDNWGCVYEAMKPFDIPVHRFQGVFWGHCMQRAMNEFRESGIDWALCIDYDSVFTQQHVGTLLGHFGKNPEIDCIAALQAKRRTDTPLMTIGLDTSAEWKGDPLKVTTAHFGLTLIRMAGLDDVEKPWFKSEPNKDNEWDDGRLDDDIWFWHQWRKGGKNIYVAPDVRIGHLELMVSQFDEDMKHELVTMPEWREQHADSLN